jgi:hypothetical protein
LLQKDPFCSYEEEVLKQSQIRDKTIQEGDMKMSIHGSYFQERESSQASFEKDHFSKPDLDFLLESLNDYQVPDQCKY